MFYTNPTLCSQSVSMATESVIIEPRRSPLLSPNKVEADEYELSLAHHQLVLFLLFTLFLSFFLKFFIRKVEVLRNTNKRSSMPIDERA